METKTPLNPLALNPDDLVMILKKSGCKMMTAELLQRDIDAGMPPNGDGTINLVMYVAWMMKELNEPE
ncbi:MAG: hypothetical protein LBH08_02755 [Puniceicoccales bacterium]|nr:hypothetical protein [Puniceicoccales bacterium]